MNIGFIGIGNMGKPIAANLLHAGYAVVVSTAFGNEKPAAELAALGAQVVTTIKEIILKAEILITVLPADKHILDVYLGPDGVLDNLADGGLCIEMTSSKGETLKQVADEANKRGHRYAFIDAPVSGGVDSARAGTLTIMVSGNKEAFERGLPILQVIGKKIIQTGAELGNAKSIKMLNQMLNAGNTCIACEVLYLADQLGIDHELLHSVVSESSGNSWVFANNVPKHIIPKQFEGGFKLELMKKDVGLAIEQIDHGNLSMPLTKLVYQVLTDEMDNGHGQNNYNIISNWIRRQNESTSKD